MELAYRILMLCFDCKALLVAKLKGGWSDWHGRLMKLGGALAKSTDFRHNELGLMSLCAQGILVMIKISEF